MLEKKEYLAVLSKSLTDERDLSWKTFGFLVWKLEFGIGNPNIR